MRPYITPLVLLGAGALLLAGVVLVYREIKYVTVEYSDYHPPATTPDDELKDDRLEDKTPPPFDPSLVDRRPLGEQGEWLVNQSAAIIKLDVAPIKPDQDDALLTLYPSYRDAFAAHRNRAGEILPSVNLIDGKAKQFDDGLYAALDQTYYQGLQDKLRSHVDLIRKLQERVDKDSEAATFLAAGLELAGVHVDTKNTAGKEKWLAEFRANEVASKPIGFYTWNETLSSCFRFLRFLQHEFGSGDLSVPLTLAKVLEQDATLRADYQKVVVFYAKLTNPYACLTLADLTGRPMLDAEGLAKLCEGKKARRQAVAVFPPSTSREGLLFERLFTTGLPQDRNLMLELIRQIRSGQVDLRPGPDSGWYDYQVYALETLLLPEKGEERNKLLLTKAYKKRMLEAFQALLTKRRETHARSLDTAKAAAAEPPKDISPRLRVEPCPSYYLRTARAYSFLADFLEAALGRESLRKLHGLKERGRRERNLHAELQFMRDLFYGLYLISAEDLGLKSSLAADEPVSNDQCYALAEKWLKEVFQDPDLAVDTRVAIPIYVDPGRNATRLWTTLGVRFVKLEASYALPPHLKPKDMENEEWKPAERDALASSHYLIPVDEFAEVELPGVRSLTREQLRVICEREKTKEAILGALRE